MLSIARRTSPTMKNHFLSTSMIGSISSLSSNSNLLRKYSTATFGQSFGQHQEETNNNELKNSQSSSEKPMFTKDMVYKYYETNHVPLAQSKFRPYGANENYTNPLELEKYQVLRSYSPVDLTDKLALGIMRILRVFVHGFFGNRYLHHAVVLETVAAVPGIVAGGWRHFNSLRLMRRDHGHIGELMEEAENERMHLLTWMEMTKPTLLERLLVVSAQVGFTSFYTMAYLFNPRFCHRLVGYLEEEAVAAYSEFLQAIDSGDIPNIKAPEIALKYWNLQPEATMRDVVLVVRADECMHRDYNHDMSDKHRAGVKV